jgi:hypothetical protein
MPQAAAIWVASFASAAIAGTAGIVAGVVAGWAAYGIAVLGISYALGAVTQALMGRPKGLGSARFRDVVVKAATAPRAIIYGSTTVGGVLVFQHTTGTKNEYLDYVIVLAGHQITAITDVWFDDVKIVNADIGSGSAAGGAVGGSGDFRVRDGVTVAYIYKYLGTSEQVASSVLSATDGTGYGPSTWTTAHRGRGVAYVHIRLRRHSKTYGQGAPSNFRFAVQGAKVYDPRLDTTNGGSGSHRLADATTWAYSNNPALCTADYIAGGTIVNDIATPIRKRGFGVNAPATSIDWASVITAANICDEDVAVPTATTQNRYECDGVVVPSDDSPDFDCLDQVLNSMLGNVTYTGGQYIVYAGAYQSPVYTLTEADLAGSLQYVAGKGRAERYNYVRGTRFDSGGQQVEFLPRTDAAYVTEDGRTLYRDIEFPMTGNEYRAQRMAQTILRRSREQQTLIWPGQLSAAKIAVWETCYVTVAELGITSKVFRCIARKQRPVTEGSDPIVELTLREENSSTYTAPIEADYGTISVASDPGPITGMLDPPSAVVAAAVPNGVSFTITPDDGAGSDEIYEIWEYTSSTPFASATLIYSGNSTIVFVPKTDTTVRYYWIRARRYQYVSATYPATTGLAVGSSSASSTLSATISHSSISASGSGSTVTTATVTSTATGGAGGNSFLWTKLSGDTIDITSNTATATTFSASSLTAGETRAANFRCRTTDSGAATADVFVTVTITRASMTAAASPTYLYKSGTTTPQTTASVTVTPTGGTATYTYAWTKVSGDSLTVNSSTSATTTFTGSVASFSSLHSVYRCTVTDSLALTATADVSITIDRNDIS